MPHQGGICLEMVADFVSMSIAPYNRNLDLS